MAGGSTSSAKVSRSSSSTSRYKPDKSNKRTPKKRVAATIDEVEAEYEEEDELLLWEQEAKKAGKVKREKSEREKNIDRMNAKGDVAAGDEDAVRDDAEAERVDRTKTERAKPSKRGGGESVASEQSSGASPPQAATVRSLTTKKEVAAGELKASAGLEQGAKQRKTNKQYQAFEANENDSVDQKKDA